MIWCWLQTWVLPVGPDPEIRNEKECIIHFWCGGDGLVGGNPSLAGGGVLGLLFQPPQVQMVVFFLLMYYFSFV